MAQSGGLGTGKMVRLTPLWCIVRKVGAPKKLCGSVRWSRHRKVGMPKVLCGPVRKHGVPQKLCVQ